MDNMNSRFPEDCAMKAATVLNPMTWPTDSDEKVLYGDVKWQCWQKMLEFQ